MAKKKVVGEPKVIVGSHSTRTEYPDGRVEFETDFDKLRMDVIAAISEYNANKLVNKKPIVKAKTARKKKDVEA